MQKIIIWNIYSVKNILIFNYKKIILYYLVSILEIFHKYMKIIITESIEKKAKILGLSFDDFYTYLCSAWEQNTFISLCSPLDWVIAYKWYISSLQRTVVFCITEKGILYPVYIWDKKDTIAKNITVQIVRKTAEKRQQQVLSDIKNRKIKIRHF